MPRHAYDQEPELIDGPEALARFQAILDILDPNDRVRFLETLDEFLENESVEPEAATDSDIPTRQRYAAQRTRTPGGGAVPVSPAQDAAFNDRWPMMRGVRVW